MKVAVLMGSDSDFPVVEKCLTTLQSFGIAYECRVLSAHRTPHEALQFSESAEENGFEVIIGAAGKAAHLPGVLAAVTTLPVIGIPIKSSSLAGMDSLYSIVQMPAGVPVATVALDGAENAAILAAQILGLKYPAVKQKLKEHKVNMARAVLAKDEALQQRIRD